MPIAGQNSDLYATEHILEFQLLTIFLESLNLCPMLKTYWTSSPSKWVTVNGVHLSPLQHVANQFPGTGNAYNGEFVPLDKQVNAAKEGVSNSGKCTHDYLVLIAEMNL